MTFVAARGSLVAEPSAAHASLVTHNFHLDSGAAISFAGMHAISLLRELG